MKTMASGPITSRQIDEEKVETASDFIFLGSKITADGDYSHKIKRCLLLWRISMTNLDSALKSTHFADKGPYRQSYGFFSSHVWMWELDHKEGWAPKNWYFCTVLLEKTLESLLDSMEIKLVNLKGNQPWIFVGRIEAKVEAPVLWQSDVKSLLTGKKGSDARKDWGQEVTEDEVVGWYQWLNGHEFEQPLAEGEGQGSLLCQSPWGHTELDMTVQLNSNEFLQFLSCPMPKIFMQAMN